MSQSQQFPVCFWNEYSDRGGFRVLIIYSLCQRITPNPWGFAAQQSCPSQKGAVQNPPREWSSSEWQWEMFDSIELQVYGFFSFFFHISGLLLLLSSKLSAFHRKNFFFSLLRGRRCRGWHTVFVHIFDSVLQRILFITEQREQRGGTSTSPPALCKRNFAVWSGGFSNTSKETSDRPTPRLLQAGWYHAGIRRYDSSPRQKSACVASLGEGRRLWGTKNEGKLCWYWLPLDLSSAGTFLAKQTKLIVFQVRDTACRLYSCCCILKL